MPREKVQEIASKGGQARSNQHERKQSGQDQDQRNELDQELEGENPDAGKNLACHDATTNCLNSQIWRR